MAEKLEPDEEDFNDSDAWIDDELDDEDLDNAEDEIDWEHEEEELPPAKIHPEEEEDGD